MGFAFSHIEISSVNTQIHWYAECLQTVSKTRDEHNDLI